jgi:hypothetical protein
VVLFTPGGYDLQAAVEEARHSCWREPNWLVSRRSSPSTPAPTAPVRVPAWSTGWRSSLRRCTWDGCRHHRRDRRAAPATSRPVGWGRSCAVQRPRPRRAGSRSSHPACGAAAGVLPKGLGDGGLLAFQVTYAWDHGWVPHGRAAERSRVMPSLAVSQPSSSARASSSADRWVRITRRAPSRPACCCKLATSRWNRILRWLV